MTVLILASILSLTNRFGSVAVDTHGARVVSYVPAGGSEVLEVLPSGCGGVPLCWPWFQFNGPRGTDSPKHGLARYRDFTVVERAEAPTYGRIVLRLRSDAETRCAWPHDFVLTVTVELSENGLALGMLSENPGDEPYVVTEAFHPYLRREAVPLLNDTGSGTFRTWDPDATSHLKTQGLGPEDWKTFVCVENGAFAPEQAVTVSPGKTHLLTRCLSPRTAGPTGVSPVGGGTACDGQDARRPGGTGPMGVSPVGGGTACDGQDARRPGEILIR